MCPSVIAKNEMIGMPRCERSVVTGAFGFTGKYITRQLLSMGQCVTTLSRNPASADPFGGAVKALPFHFDEPGRLVENLRGATTLYNTYWVRFSYGSSSFDEAVKNSRTLIESARRSGIRRIVHISVANPSETSPLPYFRGKAIVERAIIESGLSYAIVRPTVVFGIEDILINNIVWLVRRLPFFLVPGRGDYRLQPVFVEDVARMAVDAAGQEENVIIDAAGQEVYTFKELVRLIVETIKSRTKIIHVRPGPALWASKFIGLFTKDVILTHDELKALMADLLISTAPPTGRTRFSAWLQQHADRVGSQYASELKRHYRRSIVV